MSENHVVAGLVNKTAAKPSPREPPRLRVHHLLLWMAITAGWLLVMRQLHSSLVEPLVLQFGQITNGLEMGAATTIGLLGVLWMLRGLRFFNQPGQWLAVLPALEALFAALAFFVEALLVRFVGEGHHWPMMLVSQGWPMAGVCLVLAWVFVDILWWTFFLVIAIVTSIPGLAQLSGVRLNLATSEHLLLAWAPLLLLFLVLACIADWQQRDSKRLHWTHWAGLGIWLFGTFAGLATAIL